MGKLLVITGLTGLLVLQGLLFSSRLPAQPALPPDVPAGGEFVQAVSFGSIAAYGLWQMRKRK